MEKGRKRKTSSARWLQRHINDQYVESSKKLGYRSRASFKLIEINNQYELLKKNDQVLDLGAAPGSWSQVALEIVKTKKSPDVVAVDLITIEPIIGVYGVKGDIHDEEIIANIAKHHQNKYDVILSDMAPNTSGHPATDHLRIIELAETVLELTKELLKKNGKMAVKIFQGSEENLFIDEVKNYFSKVSRFKPKSSRKESSEIYIIAEGFSYEE
jgi:23S rRNA (uridine2552-2'-O)-methyltransferase